MSPKILLVVLASLAAGSAFAAPGDPTPPRAKGKDWQTLRAWGEAHIEQEDWLPIGSAGSQLWLVSALPNTDTSTYPIMRDWIRSETAGDDGPSRSFLSYIEVDCDKRRARTLEAYFFDQNNLRGPTMTGPASSDRWEPAAPGSIRESYIDSICRSAR